MPRAQTLISLSVDNMKIRKDDILCLFPNLLKTSTNGKSFQLVLHHSDEECLCVMHTVPFYIKCTENLRNSRRLLSYITHNAAQVQ